MTIISFQHDFNSEVRMILLKLTSIMAFLCLEPSNGPQLIQDKIRSLRWPTRHYMICPHLTSFLLPTLLASFLLPRHLLALFPCTRHRPICLERCSYRYSQDLLPYPLLVFVQVAPYSDLQLLPHAIPTLLSPCFPVIYHPIYMV